MNETNFSINLSDLSQRTEEQAEQIKEVLRYVKPIQTRMLGEKTVKAISRGATLESIKGGMHLDFTEVLSLLSDIASLTQIAIVVIMTLAIKLRESRKTEAEPGKEDAEIEMKISSKEELKKLILETLSEHQDSTRLNNLIATDSALLDKIVVKLTSDAGKLNQIQ